MAGHSHSANIARRKGAVDAQRAKIFSKCSKAVMSAVRQGGSDIDANLKLKYAVENAKAANMPKDSIERAIKRAAVDKSGDTFAELLYEGFGTGGVALLVACLTDNRNRTAADVKHIFERRGGNLGAPGSVSYQFEHRAVFCVEAAERGEDELMEAALDAGADDVAKDGAEAIFYAPSTSYLAVKAALERKGFTLVSAQVGYVPQAVVQVETKEDARKLLRLIGDLEEHEDVQTVFANYDMPGDWIEELSQ